MITGILVPGVGYSTQKTLFDLAERALSARGAGVEHVEWTVPGGLFEVGTEPFVRAHVAAALYRAHTKPGSRAVLIAKSLGSRAAELAAERQLPAIWLTPILIDPTVTAAITANQAPQLLIGGTADRLWLADAAAQTGHQVVEIPGADHSLHVPGPLRHYTDALATVGAAIETFLDTLLAETPGTTAPGVTDSSGRKATR